MFMGEYNHTIDAKGRLIVPSRFREILGDAFVVTKGLDGCLFVYDNEEWKLFEEKLRALPITNKEARQFVRFFLAGAAEVEVDCGSICCADSSLLHRHLLQHPLHPALPDTVYRNSYVHYEPPVGGHILHPPIGH